MELGSYFLFLQETYIKDIISAHRPPGGPAEKKHKFVVHAGGSGHYGGEERNVLIVIVLLPIAIEFCAA